MQTGVPLWVPLIVALLGALGIIAGQVVSSWREDRRWQREREREEFRWQQEREREDLRWQREQERLEAERRRDTILAWRQDRLDSLASYLAAAQECYNSIYYAGRRETIDETLTRARETFSRVELISEPDVRDAALKVLLALSDGHRNEVWEKPSGHPDGDMWTWASGYVDTKNRLLEQVRSELGIS